MRGVYENPVVSGIWWVHYYGAESGTERKWVASRMRSSCTGRARRMSSPEGSFPSYAIPRL